MAKALEANFFCLEIPLKTLHESALLSVMKCRTPGLMTTLMAARLEAILDMRRAVARLEGPFEVGKAQTPKGEKFVFFPVLARPDALVLGFHRRAQQKSQFR